MNNLIELSPNETATVTGGIDPFLLGITVAIGGFLVANWPTIKQGFADGVADGYMTTTF